MDIPATLARAQRLEDGADHEAAIRLYNAMLAEVPSYAALYMKIAACHDAMGQADAAVEAMERARRMPFYRDERVYDPENGMHVEPGISRRVDERIEAYRGRSREKWSVSAPEGMKAAGAASGAFPAVEAAGRSGRSHSGAWPRENADQGFAAAPLARSGEIPQLLYAQAQSSLSGPQSAQIVQTVPPQGSQGARNAQALPGTLTDVPDLLTYAPPLSAPDSYDFVLPTPMEIYPGAAQEVGMGAIPDLPELSDLPELGDGEGYYAQAQAAQAAQAQATQVQTVQAQAAQAQAAQAAQAAQVQAAQTQAAQIAQAQAAQSALALAQSLQAPQTQAAAENAAMGQGFSAQQTDPQAAQEGASAQYYGVANDAASNMRVFDGQSVEMASQPAMSVTGMLPLIDAMPPSIAQEAAAAQNPRAGRKARSVADPKRREKRGKFPKIAPPKDAAALPEPNADGGRYERGVILALGLCFPVGLLMLWRPRLGWSRRLRVTVTALVCLVVLLAASSAGFFLNARKAQSQYNALFRRLTDPFADGTTNGDLPTRQRPAKVLEAYEINVPREVDTVAHRASIALTEVITGREALKNIRQNSDVEDPPQGMEYVLAKFEYQVIDSNGQKVSLTGDLFESTDAAGQTQPRAPETVSLYPDISKEGMNQHEIHSGWMCFVIDPKQSSYAVFRKGKQAEIWFELVHVNAGA